MQRSNPWFSYLGRESPYLQMDGEMFGRESTQPPALFALAIAAVGLMAWPAEYGWGYDGRTHGNKGVDGHNATKRFRDHHYTTFS